MKNFLFICLLFLSYSFASSARESAFSHFYILAEGGELYPFFNLVDAVENSLYGGIGVRYTYMDNVDGFILFDYSYFKPVETNEKIYGAHQFSGKFGVDFKWKYIAPLAIGVGFACDWVRADYDDDKFDEINFSKDPGGTLTDNETEFGSFMRLNLPLIRHEFYKIGFNALWKEIWTLPKRSHMLSVGVYYERKIW